MIEFYDELVLELVNSYQITLKLIIDFGTNFIHCQCKKLSLYYCIQTLSV